MQHNVSPPRTVFALRATARILPLRRHHAADVFSHIDVDMWAGMASERLFATGIADPAVSAFAGLDEEIGTVAGTTSLYNHVPEQSRVELGMTFFGRDY